MKGLAAMAELARKAGVVPHVPQPKLSLGNNADHIKDDVIQSVNEAVPHVPHVPLENDVGARCIIDPSSARGEGADITQATYCFQGEHGEHGERSLFLEINQSVTVSEFVPQGPSGLGNMGNKPAPFAEPDAEEWAAIYQWHLQRRRSRATRAYDGIAWMEAECAAYHDTIAELAGLPVPDEETLRRATDGLEAMGVAAPAGWPYGSVEARAAFDERAALIEYGAGVPRDWAEGYARLVLAPRPKGFMPDEWQGLMDDAGRFLDEWAERAAALGWSAIDIFGVHPEVPMARVDLRGLATMIRGRRIIAMTETSATIEAVATGSRLTFRRRDMAGAVPVWELVPIRVQLLSLSSQTVPFRLAELSRE